jgi:hypothetical protein
MKSAAAPHPLQDTGDFGYVWLSRICGPCMPRGASRPRWVTRERGGPDS